jgi:hypothetical protein
MRWTKSGWLSSTICGLALLALTGPASAGPLTVQDLLAEEDRSLIAQMVEWDKAIFSLPDDLVLDEDLRQAAKKMANEHLALAKTQWPRWIEQVRKAAGDPNLRIRAIWPSIFARAINEWTILWLDSGGPAQDEAWLSAALTPQACRVVPDAPAYFARRIAMIQAAPPDARPALLAGERELLSRWGSKRKSLPPRPATADLGAADRAIKLMRAGLPHSAEPMSPFLARQVFSQTRAASNPDRFELCARNQWWLASQLAGKKVSRTDALNQYRYAALFDVRYFVPANILRKSTTEPTAEDKRPAYPPAASFFMVQGLTKMQVEADEQGRFVQAVVIARDIKVPGITDNPPVAFEMLLDGAAVEHAKQQHSASPKTAGKYQFDLIWKLDGSEHATR